MTVSPLLVRAVDGVKPGRALDLACGEGRHALYLARLGWRVTAVDSSQAKLDTLQARTGGESLSIDIRLIDLERDPFPGGEEDWDLICDILYLQRDLFRRIRAGLRPGGLFVAAILLRDGESQRFRLERGELGAAFESFRILHYDEEASHSHRPCVEMIAQKP